ncbi:acyl-CoA N-acyltransferase [Aspergillus leporis]|uniref:Acyl-CoA N-acyltransferase n=1 Tax=Aspergillus leporis TaxID=41062 RepID=A0A5N5WT80_9EURO|nr:acyl-CoA N-acyltransferase [Aspergillus leporis]
MSTFNPFRSKQLAYRAIEDTPEDENFIHAIQSDPQSFATSNTTLLRPQAKRDTLNGYKTGLIKHSLLSAIILLPTPNDHDEQQEHNLDTAVTAKETWTPIGIVALRSDGAGHSHHRASSITIDIASQYQNRGYGGEAIEWVLDWGFRKTGLHRIWLESLSYNPGASHLYERLGFQLEGRQREAIWLFPTGQF